MGRIRSIKPDFFIHEDLFDAEKASKLPLRLAFSGLWTQCDREGRFHWRPRMLKTDILPYDDLDFEKVLNALAEHGFVQKYVVDGNAFGFIPSWSKHQYVNQREAESAIPCPDPCTHVHARVEREREQEREQEREGKDANASYAREDERVSILKTILDETRARAVVEHRKGFRAKFTPHAANLLAKKFAKCSDPNEAADAMIANGWQGFEPEWLNGRKNGTGPPRVSRTQEAAQELIEEIRNGKFNGGSGICEQGGGVARRELSQPAARSENLSHATDDPAHWGKRIDLEADG